MSTRAVQAVLKATGVIYETEIEPLIRERNAWIETAAFHSRNEDYYRGLVIKIGEMLGPAAYVSDDGSVQQDVLCAKVPELVAAALSEIERMNELVLNLALSMGVEEIPAHWMKGDRT